MALEPLADLLVVDLFAGSGALGIEALSRGALSVDFVEWDRQARRTLEENLATLGLADQATVWALELPQGLKRLGESLATADLVLADPPYGGPLARAVLAGLGGAGVLKSGARVVLEHHAKDAIDEGYGRLARVRVRAYGETVVSTFRAADGESPATAEEPRA